VDALTADLAVMVRRAVAWSLLAPLTFLSFGCLLFDITPNIPGDASEWYKYGESAITCSKAMFLERLVTIHRLQLSRTCCGTAILNFDSSLNTRSRRPITVIRILLSLLLLHGDIKINPGPERNHRLSKNNLFCLLQNVRSLKANFYDTSANTTLNKLSCLQNIVYGNDIEVIALTETWLSDQVGNNEMLPVGYNIFRRDRRTGKRGGGVLLDIY